MPADPDRAEIEAAFREWCRGAFYVRETRSVDVFAAGVAWERSRARPAPPSGDIARIHASLAAQLREMGSGASEMRNEERYVQLKLGDWNVVRDALGSPAPPGNAEDGFERAAQEHETEARVLLSRALRLESAAERFPLLDAARDQQEWAERIRALRRAEKEEPRG